MILRLIIAAGLLSMVGACVVGPYEGRPAYYNGGYNTGYDRAYNGRYENGGYNHSYNYNRTYQ